MSPGDPGLFDDGEGPEGTDESTPSPFFVAVEAATAVLGGKAIGRPKGAGNRKSKSFEKWFYARGYKDPAVFLAEIFSADPIALRSQIPGADMLDVLQLQVKAAGELMPYLHGKKPTDLSDVPDEQLPHLFIMAGTNQLEQASVLLEAQRRALSAGTLIEGNEIKDLGEAGGERLTGERLTEGETPKGSEG